MFGWVGFDDVVVVDFVWCCIDIGYLMRWRVLR